MPGDGLFDLALLNLAGLRPGYFILSLAMFCERSGDPSGLRFEGVKLDEGIKPTKSSKQSEGNKTAQVLKDDKSDEEKGRVAGGLLLAMDAVGWMFIL